MSVVVAAITGSTSLRRFNIEKARKFITSRSTMNLPEMLGMYPSLGKGFSIFTNKNKYEYYLIHNIYFKVSKLVNS